MIALSAIGLCKGFFASMTELIEEKSSLQFDEVRKQQMNDVLEEIYERCIERTDVREVADIYLRAETNGTMA